MISTPAQVAEFQKTQLDTLFALSHTMFVSLGNGASEADILVHDQTNRTLAYMLAHLETPKPVGVFHVEARPAYEDAMAKQIEVARQREGDGDIDALLNRGETWVVE